MLIKKFYTKSICDLKKNLVYTTIFQRKNSILITSFKFVRFIGVDKHGDLYVWGIITDTHGDDTFTVGLGYKLLINCTSVSFINIIIKEGYYAN